MTSYIERPDTTGSRRVAYEVRGDGPLVVTVPGMGDLRSTDAELGDAATASDITALIETLGGPAVVVGSSMGASSAVLVAADRPDLLAGLVLLSPFVRNGSGDARLMR